MKRIFKFLFLSTLIFTMLLHITVFAEPQLPYIEGWCYGVAYTSNYSFTLSDCIAYDYLSDKTDKFVRLDADGKETARAADPDMLTDSVQAVGTVTVAVTMPDEIDNAVDIVLCDESGKEFSLTAYKDNNYIAYSNIPPGTYTMCSAGLRDDYKGEYPAKWDTGQIVIEPLGAAKVNVTISDKQDLTNPDTYKKENDDNTNNDKENLLASSSPDPNNNASMPIIGMNYRSLILSTILTIAALALLLLCYKLVIWRKEYKHNRKDDEE